MLHESARHAAGLLARGLYGEGRSRPARCFHEKGLKTAHKTLQEALAAVYAAGRLKEAKVDAMLKAVGMMLADLDTDPEVWRKVRSKLNRMIEEGDLTSVQVECSRSRTARWRSHERRWSPKRSTRYARERSW